MTAVISCRGLKSLQTSLEGLISTIKTDLLRLNGVSLGYSAASHQMRAKLI
jgi:hypothetical protein